jgi:carboxylesterase type B
MLFSAAGTLRGLRTTANGAAGAYSYQFLGVRYAEPMNASRRWTHLTARRPWNGTGERTRPDTEPSYSHFRSTEKAR